MNNTLKLTLLSLLLLAGCAKEADVMVGGDYQGFFGNEFSGSKVGIGGQLNQTGNVFIGNITLQAQLRQNPYANTCTVEGQVKGKKVSMKFHGQNEKLELELEGERKDEPQFSHIVGQAKIISGDDTKIKYLLNGLKKGDTIPFDFKNTSFRTREASPKP